MLGSLSRECAVEVRPTISLDPRVQIATELEMASRPEFERGQMRGAGAQFLADLLTNSYAIAAIVGPADRADIHQTYLSGVETGKRNPSLLVLERIGKGLGADVEDLVKKAN